MLRRIRDANVVGGLSGFGWLAITIVPIYYIVVTSLRPQSDYFSENPLSIPSNPTMAAYGRVLRNDFALYFMNSVIVTVSSVIVISATSFMAAYVIVRRRTPGSARLFQALLLGIAIPIQATIVPVYYLIVQLGLYDSLLALILPAIAFAIPLSVLILTTFLRDVPDSLFESMNIDGAGEWRTMWSLALPMTKPAVVTVAVYTGLNVWNGFLFPLVLTQSASTRVIPLSLWSFQGEFAVDIPAVLAAVVLSVLPILAAYIVGRRYLVSGMTQGFSK